MTPWFGIALAVMRLDAGRFQVVCVDTDDATALVDCLTWLIEKSLVLVEDGPNGERWYVSSRRSVSSEPGSYARLATNAPSSNATSSTSYSFRTKQTTTSAGPAHEGR